MHSIANEYSLRSLQQGINTVHEYSIIMVTACLGYINQSRTAYEYSLCYTRELHINGYLGWTNIEYGKNKFYNANNEWVNIV